MRYLLLCIFMGVLLLGCGQSGGEDVFTEPQQAEMIETLREYGYPQEIIDRMEPALKEQICREGVRFYGANIVYEREDGLGRYDRVREFTYVGPADGQEVAIEEIPQEYDFCLALVVGVCYQDGELEHILCSVNYEWHTLPEERREDTFLLTWDGEVLWKVSDSCPCSWSQISEDGRREGLGFDPETDNFEYGRSEWETNMEVASGKIQGFTGSGWVQLRPVESAWQTMELTALRGTYRYERKTTFMHQGTHFDADLKISLPQEREETQ